MYQGTPANGGKGTYGAMENISYENGKKVTYRWKVEEPLYAGWKVNIEVTITTQSAWGWATVFYTYESVEY